MEFPGATGEDIEWLQNGFVSAIKVTGSTDRISQFRHLVFLSLRKIFRNTSKP